MKKLLILSLVAVSTIYASPMNLSLSEEHPQDLLKQSASTALSIKKQNVANVANTFAQQSNFLLAQPIKLTESKGLQIDEGMINEDIELVFNNQIATPMNVDYVGYNIDGNICAENKDMKLTLETSKLKSGYYISRTKLLNCYAIASKTINNIGNFKLVDISSKLDHVKYQDFTNGLFLLPMTIIVHYSHSNIKTIKYKTTYLIYAKN